jgi:hypothetical protein
MTCRNWNVWPSGLAETAGGKRPSFRPALQRSRQRRALDGPDSGGERCGERVDRCSRSVTAKVGHDRVHYTWPRSRYGGASPMHDRADNYVDVAAWWSLTLRGAGLRRKMATGAYAALKDKHPHWRCIGRTIPAVSSRSPSIAAVSGLRRWGAYHAAGKSTVGHDRRRPLETHGYDGGALMHGLFGVQTAASRGRRHGFHPKHSRLAICSTSAWAGEERRAIRRDGAICSADLSLDRPTSMPGWRTAT